MSHCSWACLSSRRECQKKGELGRDATGSLIQRKKKIGTFPTLTSKGRASEESLIFSRLQMSEQCLRGSAQPSGENNQLWPFAFWAPEQERIMEQPFQVIYLLLSFSEQPSPGLPEIHTSLLSISPSPLATCCISCYFPFIHWTRTNSNCFLSRPPVSEALLHRE